MRRSSDFISISYGVMRTPSDIMRKSCCLALSLLMALLLSSCHDEVVHYEYQHTSLSGWEKVDSLRYNVHPLKESGVYDVSLGMRINTLYPFQKITLIVSQTRYPQRTLSADTLNCRLIDENGKAEKKGVSIYNFTFPVRKMNLQQGDSLHICVNHNMKRDLIPGICDIGIIIKKEK